jgi:uncharacterized protein (TIGR00730 family)
MSAQLNIRKISVFCGASSGMDPAYRKAAFDTGKHLAEQGIGVVFGGGKVGLMGALADGAIAAGGEVIGVIPRFLKEKELAHPNVSLLVETDTMHERKMKMNDLCDGVIALPGGFGTLDELFEMLTWAQLGLHRKPVALLNVQSFFDPLLNLIQSMTDRMFLKEAHRDMILHGPDIGVLLERMRYHQPPDSAKWIIPGQQ